MTEALSKEEAALFELQGVQRQQEWARRRFRPPVRL
jgi:hypothetical protein